jgi:hypothetical protein
MEASNIVKAIKSIREKSSFREFDESIPDVVTRVDLEIFYQRIMGLVEALELIVPIEETKEA